jgi:hypothetical protein
MKRCVGAILIFLLGMVCYPLASERETLEDLIKRADAAPPGQQADLFLEVADREMKAAADSYAANKDEDGASAVQQVVNYSDKAHALVLQSGKKLPHTEIKIRRLAARLRDLKQNVDAEEHPVVQAAVEKMEGFRTELLKAMFGAKGAMEKK